MWIECQDIHKHYGPVKANNGINLTISPGSIHGLLGENGAGKSTLVKILAGFTPKTRGSVLIDGSPALYRNPCQATRLGIGMLYQDPLDFPRLSVLTNFMLGQPLHASGSKDLFRKKLQQLADSFNFSLQPETPVDRLTVGERQQLEILRLMALGIQVLILDEPTTGISSTQRSLLFDALKKLAEDGKTIIFVSHKLEDIEQLCTTVTVLRQGTVSGTMDRPFQIDRLLEMMFGKPPAMLSRSMAFPGENILVMDRVSAAGERTGLHDATIAVRQSEVVGLAGLEGSGQGVFLRTACGLASTIKGSVQIMGRNMKACDYHDFNRSGVTFMPAARLEEGLISGLCVAEHFALLEKEKSFVIKWNRTARWAMEKIDAFHIKGMPESQVNALSGGNQQRLLLSFLPENPVLLLLENPTRGLDMESVIWVWRHLHQYCHNKTSVVFSSTELDEILMVADRALVFFNGRIVKDVQTSETDIHELGRAVSGKV